MQQPVTKPTTAQAQAKKAETIDADEQQQLIAKSVSVRKQKEIDTETERLDEREKKIRDAIQRASAESKSRTQHAEMTVKEKEQHRLAELARLKTETTELKSQYEALGAKALPTGEHVYNTDGVAPIYMLPPDQAGTAIQAQAAERQAHPSVQAKKAKEHQTKEMRDVSQRVKDTQGLIVETNQSHDTVAKDCTNTENKIKEVNDRKLEETFNEQGKEIDELKKQLAEKLKARNEAATKLDSQSQQNKVATQTIIKTNYLDELCSHLRNQLEALDGQFYQLEHQNQNASELLSLTNDDLEVLRERIELTQKRIETDKAKLGVQPEAEANGNETLRKEIEALAAENEALAKKVEEARASGQATGKTERAAKRQVRQAQHEIRETQDAVDESQSRIRELQAKIDSVKRANM